MIQKTRESLFGQGERGVEPVQRPIPGRVPAEPKKGAPAPVAGEEEGITDEQRQEMIRETMTTMAKMQAGGRPTMPQKQYEPQAPGQAPMVPRLQEWGAEKLSPEMQFYRIAGRNPSPRELAVFSSRIELERELGRVPTRSELKAYIARGVPMSPAHPRAFEAD